MANNDFFSAIKMHYFIRIPNVGDLINPFVVSSICKRPTIWIDNRDKPHLLAIGSIVASASQESIVWGSGVMHPDLGLGNARPTNINALRGPLSYTALRRVGLALGDIPLGDPGYLAASLWGIKPTGSPRFRLGIVAHYVDRYNPAIRHLLHEESVLDLNVHDSPHTFLSRMAECETIASTSLHGLIFAESLGIPNLWLKVGDEIGGGNFKFNDWFATCRYPQAQPYCLETKDTVESLVIRAELHDCKIERQALIDAFPIERIELYEEMCSQTFIPVEDCRSRPTPVFFISFNRGGMLKQAISAVRLQRKPVEIVVHDNGTNDKATLQILSELQNDGIRIVRKDAINSADELNSVDETIQTFFSNWGELCRYIVSDCDVDISVAAPQALDIYNYMLNRFRKVECIGPMLRIHDIPPSYPLFNRVMNRHIEQFWHKIPEIGETPIGLVAFIEAMIDTTFALHRAGEHFRRLKSGIRVYEPYEALHLDWYRNERDGVYTKTSNSTISHWDNRKEFVIYKDVSLEYSYFYLVKIATNGDFKICLEKVGVYESQGSCQKRISPL